jgi:hypothetical protein
MNVGSNNRWASTTAAAVTAKAKHGNCPDSPGSPLVFQQVNSTETSKLGSPTSPTDKDSQYFPPTATLPQSSVLKPLYLCRTEPSLPTLVRAEYPNSDIYEGEWYDGKPHGRGTMTEANGNVYTGEWSKGKQHGNGRMIGADRNIYAGQQGGVVTYDGQWYAGKPHGTGTLIEPTGTTLVGDFIDGKPHGVFHASTSDGKLYHIDYVNGIPVKSVLIR